MHIYLDLELRKNRNCRKFIDGSYSKRDFISSFASIFPVDNPKYVCVVSIDSPKYGYHWGNETAAPVINGIFSRIINDIEKPTLYTNLNQSLIKKPTSSYENVTKKINVNVPTLKTKKSISLKESKQIPNFIGKTLKESLKLSKNIGLKLENVGFSGRVVWQHPKPGSNLKYHNTCKIKLESRL